MFAFSSFVNFCKNIRNILKVLKKNVDIKYVRLLGFAMDKNFSINLDDFVGIYRAMAEKANSDNNKTLEGSEISIFNDIYSTYNKNNNTLIFEHDYYDENGNITYPYVMKHSESDSTNLFKIKSIDNIDQSKKNLLAIQKAKNFAQQAEMSKDETIIVTQEDGKELFRYNRTALEDYIINDAVDKNGHKLTKFAEITNIRKKNYSARTKAECRLLSEFNNMVNYVIDAGTEYGVNPNLIMAIIQQEVGFDGLSDDVTGGSGKGYMQITSAPVKDMLGGYTDKQNNLVYDSKFKIDKYGPEFVELLQSRGFNTDCPQEARDKLRKDIVNYLIKNKDPEFNIRLGTLILRYYLKTAKGNVALAAENYNGKDNTKTNYRKAVYKYYNQICNKLGNQAIT